MAYIGKNPSLTFAGISRYDSFTGDGSTVIFDLTFATLEGGQNDIQVFVNSVRQEPGISKDYTLGVDGSNEVKRITFTVAPTGSAEIFVISPGRETALVQPNDNSVSTAKIQDGAVTGTQINSTFDISAKTVTLPTSSIANDKLVNSSITINGVSAALGASVTIAAGTDWQTVIVADGSTVTSASAGEGYFINTTSAVHTIQLPAAPTIGDEISIIDYAGTFDTNALTVDRNGKPIQGSAANLTVATERAGFTLVFVDDTQGWLLKDK